MQTPHVVWEQDSLRVVQYAASDAQHLAVMLARFRLSCFREYPYLYKGTLEAELQTFADFFADADAQVTVLYDNDTPVGLATHRPMVHAFAHLLTPFEEAGLQPSGFYYYSEGIIEPKYRGKGIGTLFQTCVERSAMELDLPYVAAMTVQREPDHPLCPKGYQSFDGYMHRFNYEIIPNLTLTISWPTMPHGEEEGHRLQFWKKSVRAGC